jgi:hypothetical protein
MFENVKQEMKCHPDSFGVLARTSALFLEVNCRQR